VGGLEQRLAVISSNAGLDVKVGLVAKPHRGCAHLGVFWYGRFSPCARLNCVCVCVCAATKIQIVLIEMLKLRVVTTSTIENLP
jgi:hypothetical protein